MISLICRCSAANEEGFMVVEPHLELQKKTDPVKVACPSINVKGSLSRRRSEPNFQHCRLDTASGMHPCLLEHPRVLMFAQQKAVAARRPLPHSVSVLAMTIGQCWVSRTIQHTRSAAPISSFSRGLNSRAIVEVSVDPAFAARRRLPHSSSSACSVFLRIGDIGSSEEDGSRPFHRYDF